MLLDHMQAVEQHFSHFAKLDTSLKVIFQESEITLNIPEEGIYTQEGWKITPMTYPVVCSYCMQVCVSASTDAIKAVVFLCRLLRGMLMSLRKGTGFLSVS